MATSADFKATVQSFLERPVDSRLPSPGEVMLLGTTAGGDWGRGRIPRRYRWFDGLMIRAFIRMKAIDRLAIVIADDPRQPRQMRVAFADSEALHGAAGISDPKLARLVAAAAREWSQPRRMPPPMRTWFGVPYPLALLALILSSELAFDLVRIPRLLSGNYSWLPIIPSIPADILFAAYLTLVGASVVLVWRQASLGFGLAWLLSAVQFVRPLALYVPLVKSYGLGTVEFWLVWSWSFPAVIWVLFALLYLERVRTART